jgi:hypothetical protein
MVRDALPTGPGSPRARMDGSSFEQVPARFRVCEGTEAPFWNFLPLTSYFSSQLVQYNDWRRFMGWLSRFFETKDYAKVENPATAFTKPIDVVKDSSLSKTEKVEALDAWEQDARQLMTASNEGMAGPQEGRDLDDHHKMGKVLRAKEKIGRMPNYKSAH